MTILDSPLMVRSERLDLPLMDPALLDALVEGDRAAIDRLAPYAIPADFPHGPSYRTGDIGDTARFLGLRRDQLAADPERFPWSVRAIVLRAERRMIGYVNFHGRPGVNDIEEPEAAELGWTVFDEERGRGYATEVALALMDWATREHGVRRFISATRPENAASLRVHEKLGFVRTGQVVDGEVIFELKR